jgi:hypothetical protein
MLLVGCGFWDLVPPLVTVTGDDWAFLVGGWDMSRGLVYEFGWG